jgi:hypothetical protein
MAHSKNVQCSKLSFSLITVFKESPLPRVSESPVHLFFDIPRFTYSPNNKKRLASLQTLDFLGGGARI